MSISTSEIGQQATIAAAQLDISQHQTLLGVADGSTHLGTFTGTTIADSQTVKAALQSLETAVEAIEGATPGGTDLAYSAGASTGTVTSNTGDDATITARTDSLAGLMLPADKAKLDGIEAGADVTDTANVTAAGALMDSEVDANLKTLVLPASTTISAYGRTLVDDADAAAARTTLGLGTAATSNTTAFATANQGAKADAAVPTSAIGNTVQAYSSVLQNTTASFTTADETKLDYLTVTAAANVDTIRDRVYTNKSAASSDLVVTETDAALITARTTAIQALIDAQQGFGEVRRFGSGYFQINPGLLLDRASVIVGEDSQRTIFKLPTTAHGDVFKTRNYSTFEANGTKWEHEGGSNTGVPSVVTFHNVGFVQAVQTGAGMISDDPMKFNTTALQNSKNQIRCVKLWASGHRLTNLSFSGIYGTCIQLEEGSSDSAKSNQTCYWDRQTVWMDGIYVNNAFVGVEAIAGADGHFHRILTQNCRDYGLRLMAHAAAYLDEIHSWGCGIGIEIGNSVVAASPIGRLQGDNDLLGVRLATSDSHASNVMGKNCHLLGLDVVERAHIDHFDGLIRAAINYTPTAYSPLQKPFPARTYLSLHTGDPGTWGKNNEVTGSGYSRPLVSRWVLNDDESGDSGKKYMNQQAVTFVAADDWGTVTHMGLWSGTSTSDSGTNSLQFLGGWALAAGVAIDTETYTFARRSIKPVLDPRPTREFSTSTLDLVPATHWKTGAPLAVRIRQSAPGTSMKYCRIAGSGKAVPGVALELRGSRPKIFGYITNCYDGLVLNYAAMRDADIFLIMQECTNGVRIYADDENQVPESYGTAQTASGATVTVTDGASGSAVLTLSSGTWPQRVVGGFVQIGLGAYAVTARNSDTEITVTRSGANPANASGLSFCWFRGYNWYSTGTVTTTGSDSNVTLSGGTWPEWVVGGHVYVGGTTYPVTGRTSDTVITVTGTPGAVSGGYFEVVRSSLGNAMRNNRITILHSGLTTQLIDMTGAYNATKALSAQRFVSNIQSNKVTFLALDTSHYETFTTDVSATLTALTAASATAEDCANAIGALQQKLFDHGILDGAVT